MAPEDLDAVFFTNSGSESVDTALKIALAYHQARGECVPYAACRPRTRLPRRRLRRHERRRHRQQPQELRTALLPGVLHLPTTYDHGHQAFSRGQPEWGAHLADELERIVAVNHPSTIAAVIVEPFSGSAGVLVPPVGYLERLREITAHYGILLIFDEVITAFGRLGASFAATRFEVVPDLITCAKGITSGTVPMGAVLARESVRSTIIDNAPDAIELFHGYTYSGHPLASAAAMATLDVYEDEQLFERARKLAPVFEDALHTLADKPHVKDIRNIGLAGAVELEPRASEPGTRGSAAFADAYDRGLLIRTTGDIIALAPPLIASREDIECIATTLGDVLEGVR